MAAAATRRSSQLVMIGRQPRSSGKGDWVGGHVGFQAHGQGWAMHAPREAQSKYMSTICYVPTCVHVDHAGTGHCCR